MDSRLASVTVAVVLDLWAGSTRAEFPLPGAVLTVQNRGPLEACVDEGSLGARILAQFPAQPATPPSAAKLRIDVAVGHATTGFVAELQVSGAAGGMRHIDASQCQGLIDALAVTVAMILDQDTEERARDGANQGEATGTAQVPRQSTESPLPVTISSRLPSSTSPSARIVIEPRLSKGAPASGIRLGKYRQLRAWIGGGYGSSGQIDVESGLELYIRNWGVRVGALWHPTHETALGTGRIRTMTIGGGAAGCMRFGDDFRPVLCLKTAIGGERIRRVGFVGDSPGPLPIWTIGPSLGIETGTRWVTGLELSGQVSAWHDSYYVENSSDRASIPLFVAWLVARVALSTDATHARQ